jgi:hypothetical protein
MRAAGHGATFRAGDRAELVRASFSCPVCLHAAHTVHLADSRPVPVAEVRCPACAAFWQVELDLGQALRLLGDPRVGLEVRLGAQAARMGAAHAVRYTRPP